MKVKLWLVKFGDNWSRQTVQARNIEQAMRRARRLHIKETRDNDWGRSTEILPITHAELWAEGEDGKVHVKERKQP